MTKRELRQMIREEINKREINEVIGNPQNLRQPIVDPNIRRTVSTDKRELVQAKNDPELNAFAIYAKELQPALQIINTVCTALQQNVIVRKDSIDKMNLFKVRNLLNTVITDYQAHATETQQPV